MDVATYWFVAPAAYFIFIKPEVTFSLPSYVVMKGEIIYTGQTSLCVRL